MIGRDGIKKLLEQLSKGEITQEEALSKLSDLPFKDIGHTKIDNHRELRTGYPEIVFCEGKTPAQVPARTSMCLEPGLRLRSTGRYKKDCLMHNTMKWPGPFH